MRSIKEIFVIGHGPSSSHTMGPSFAVDYILNKYPSPQFVKCTLFGSLASTGSGHLTDYIIDLKLKSVPHEITLDHKTRVKHPNTMVFIVTDNQGKNHKEPIISIGGGTIVTKGETSQFTKDIYPHNTLDEILSSSSLVPLPLRFVSLSVNDNLNTSKPGTQH